MIYYVNKFVSNLIESEIMDGWEEGSKKLISNSAMKAMEDFVTNWKGGD